MTPYRIRFLLATCIVLTATSIVAAGPVAGIARTDGQPLETGPFDSYSTANGPQIKHQFQSMYLTSQPNVWTKTFQWEIAPNTGLVPGDTLSITESIPLIYPDNPAGTDPLVQLPISDWHESIASGDLSDFFQWDSQSPTTSISASIDGEEIPIHAACQLLVGRQIHMVRLRSRPNSHSRGNIRHTSDLGHHETSAVDRPGARSSHDIASH